MTNVLVPIDGFEESLEALDTALDMFPDGDITALHVLQVTKFPDDPAEPPSAHAEEVSDDVLAEARDLASDRGRTINMDSREGEAGKTIVSYADDEDVDHIVMGSTGRSGLTRLLLGSVAETVMRRSTVPVTVTR